MVGRSCAAVTFRRGEASQPAVSSFGELGVLSLQRLFYNILIATYPVTKRLALARLSHFLLPAISTWILPWTSRHISMINSSSYNLNRLLSNTAQ
jgi:hypothetical protein